MPTYKDKILFNSKSTEYSWLSNFYPSPIKSTKINAVFPTVEHAYQAAKFTDPMHWEAIARLSTGAEAKAYVKKHEWQREWTDSFKLRVMEKALRLKFRGELRKQLMSNMLSGIELVHYCPWGDTFWGVDKNLVGENHQGKLIMQIREECWDQQVTDWNW